METLLSYIIDPDNIRMVLLAVFGWSGYMLMGRRMDRIDHKIDMVESSLNRRIDGVESSLSAQIKELKYNDFAHLNGAIEILIHTLEKNGALQPEDKAFIDSRLSH